LVASRVQTIPERLFGFVLDKAQDLVEKILIVLGLAKNLFDLARE